MDLSLLPPCKFTLSAHLALELSRKELKMFFTQFSQAPKHNGERLDRKQ